MAEDDDDLERDLRDVGNKLLSPPSDTDELFNLLNLADNLLSRVEQEPSVPMRNALYPIMKALIAKDLLNHPEMDVKVALASCFSEITVITSPVDPYDEDLMKDIFRIIVDALRNIDDVSSRTYYKKVSILENIANVHSCVLMLDLECDDLILEMFQHFLRSIRPVNAQRVFSSMETIMTTLLNQSEDELLSCFLDSMVKDLKDALPIARSLADKVMGNCAGKLKPHLIELVHSNDTYCSDYGDIVASICQENFSELNAQRTCGECLVYNSKLFGVISDELPQKSGRREPDVDCPKDIDTPADKPSKLVLANGIVRRGHCGAVIRCSSLELNPESYSGIDQPQIASAAATAELDDSSSLIVANSEALLVPRSSGDRSKEADCSSSKGAFNNDQKEEERRVLSEDARKLTIAGNNASVEKPLRKSCKPTQSQNSEEGKTELLKLSQKETGISIDSEAETLSQKRTRRPSRKVIETVLLEQEKSRNKQQTQNTNLKKDLAGEKILKSNCETKIVGISPKNTDNTIGSGEINRCRGSTRKSTRKATRIESSEHQKSIIEQLTGKLIVEDDLAGEQSLKVAKVENCKRKLDDSLVGCKIKVWWPDDETYYKGFVHSYDPVTKKHKVAYDDGDEEILSLKDECWKLLKDNVKPDIVRRQGKKFQRPNASPDMQVSLNTFAEDWTSQQASKFDEVIPKSECNSTKKGGDKSGFDGACTKRKRSTQEIDDDASKLQSDLDSSQENRARKMRRRVYS